MIRKVAVTGASGFIGRYVVRELLERGVSVVAIARDSERLAEFGNRVDAIQMDIANPPRNLFERLEQPDVLLHLAWDGLHNYHSLHHYEQELPRHYAFLKMLIEDGLKSIVVSGTCFEYGLQSGPLSEDLYSRPNNPYGFAKDILRQQLEYIRATHPFNLVWARLFYLYGDGQSKNSLWSQLQIAAQQGMQVFNMSGGEQLRDYLSVETVAKYLVLLALTGKDYGVVNVCSGNPISIRMLVENWIAERQWHIRLNLGYYSYPDYEPMAFWGDRSKLDACLEEK